MIVLHVTLRLTPDGIEEFTRRLPELVSLTRAEDGCVEYDFARDLLESEVIRITECWESEDALERHKATVHYRDFTAAMPQVLGFSRRSYVAEPVTLDDRPSVPAG